MKLILTDSAIRESLRYHSILIKGLTKEVVCEGGLELPDGTHIPRGSWIGIPVLGLHLDGRFYPDPRHYDPFRFAKLKQDRTSSQRKEALTEKPTNIKNLDAGQPSQTNLSGVWLWPACLVSPVKTPAISAPTVLTRCGF